MRSFAIIPAAGRSRRMGRHKLLLPWNGGTVVEAVLQIWLASRVDRIIFVVRPDDAKLLELLRRSAAKLGRDRCRVVAPASPPAEMKDSVRIALDDLNSREGPDPGDVWLLAPADMPNFSASTVNVLLDAFAAERHRILAPTYEGKRGHPVLFSWRLAREVTEIPEDEGIRWLLGRHDCGLVPCSDASILEDMDTPEDYTRLKGLD